MKFVILLRGINVGGKNIVKMDHLKQMLLNLGLSKVITYIQSGNAVFESNLDEESLRNSIQTSFTERFGFKTDIMIRSIDQIKLLIDELPFSEDQIAAAEAADSQVEHLYIYFLEQQPEQSQVEAIGKGYEGPDTICIGKKEVYFLCHQSVRNSKLANRIAKVFGSSTSRNLKTVNKLYEIMISL